VKLAAPEAEPKPTPPPKLEAARVKSWLGGRCDAREVEPPIRQKQRLSIRLIKEVVADDFEVSVDNIDGHSRLHEFVIPRMIGMYLCRSMTIHSFPEIGRRFGGKDHTTCLWAFRKIGQSISTDAKLAERVSLIKAKILALT